MAQCNLSIFAGCNTKHVLCLSNQFTNHKTERLVLVFGMKQQGRHDVFQRWLTRHESVQYPYVVVFGSNRSLVTRRLSPSVHSRRFCVGALIQWAARGQLALSAIRAALHKAGYMLTLYFSPARVSAVTTVSLCSKNCGSKLNIMMLEMLYMKLTIFCLMSTSSPTLWSSRWVIRLIRSCKTGSNFSIFFLRKNGSKGFHLTLCTVLSI